MIGSGSDKNGNIVGRSAWIWFLLVTMTPFTTCSTTLMFKVIRNHQTNWMEINAIDFKVFDPSSRLNQIVFRPIRPQICVRFKGGEGAPWRPGCSHPFVSDVDLTIFLFLGIIFSMFHYLPNQVAAGVIISEGKVWQEQRRYALRTLRWADLESWPALSRSRSWIGRLRAHDCWSYTQRLWIWQSWHGGSDQWGGGYVHPGGDKSCAGEIPPKYLAIRWKRAKENLLTLSASLTCRS